MTAVTNCIDTDETGTGFVSVASTTATGGSVHVSEGACRMDSGEFGYMSADACRYLQMPADASKAVNMLVQIPAHSRQSSGV